MTKKIRDESPGAYLVRIRSRANRISGVLTMIISFYGRDEAVIEGKKEIEEARKNLQEALEIINTHFPPEKPADVKGAGSVPPHRGEDFGE